MKIILSRKGFDSKYGGYPSPILPDGRMISLPIPSQDDARPYTDVLYEQGRTLWDLMSELGMKHDVNSSCHLDPDLHEAASPRQSGWKPSLGQLGSAQTHLRNQNVEPGDLFLFFGWFGFTEIRNGKLQYLRGRNNHFHAIFGYLEIGEIVHVRMDTTVPVWLEGHPHVLESRRQETNNTLYIAADNLSLNNTLPGAGLLRFSEAIRLTKPGFTRSRWDLDQAIFANVPISHHSPSSWKEEYFQSAAIGQEFVIAANEKVVEWTISKLNSRKEP